MKQLTQFNSYRIRPEPVPGESLSGYCWRFYLANGVELPSALNINMKHFRRRPSMMISGSVIEQIFGHARVLTMLRDEVNAAYLVHSYGGSSWFLQDAHGQFCIPCLQDHGIHWRRFNLPHITACPEHAVLLVRNCTVCSASLTWGRMGEGWTCRCGERLTDMAVTPASAHELALSRWILTGDLSAVSQAKPNEHSLSPDLLEKYRTLWMASQLRDRLRTANDRQFKPIQVEPIRGHSWSPSRWDLKTAMDSQHVIAERFTRFLISNHRTTGFGLEHIHRWEALSMQLRSRETLCLDTSAVLMLALHTLARVREEAAWERYGGQ